MTDETDLARLARIGDSVFAVVVTLLVYRVRLPSQEALATMAIPALLPFLTDLGTVVTSFVVASLFWMGHWRVFRRMRRADVRFVALNFVFLGTLVLLPISTSLMGITYGQGSGALAYCINLFLLAAATTAFRGHARRLEPQAFGTVAVLLSPTLLMAVFGGAAVFVTWRPWLAQALLSAALLAPLVETRWGMGRLGRELPLPAERSRADALR